VSDVFLDLEDDEEGREQIVVKLPATFEGDHRRGSSTPPHSAALRRSRRGAPDHRRGRDMRIATEHDFRDDLELTVRELLARGTSTRAICGIVSRAIACGPFEVEDDDLEESA
jgi:hypothetical protein